MGQGKKWTEEEKEYLEEFWGIKSINAICVHLGRSVNAINVMRHRLSLGPFLEAGGYITLHQLYIALGLGSATCSYKNKSWIENRGLPVKYKTLSEKRVKVIYLEEFWKWAEKNRAFLDFSKFEENSLGMEPSWVKEKRRRDARAPRQTKWTENEDFRLRQLVEKREYGLKEVARLLDRSEGAVIRRLSELGIKTTPVKADNHTEWTNDEFNIITEGIKNGEKFRDVALKLPLRSEKALRGLVYRYYLTENADRVRSMIGKGEFGDNLPERSLKHFRIMDPEEKFLVKENMEMMAGILHAWAEKRSAAGEKYEFYFQKDMCMHWDNIRGCKKECESCDDCTEFLRIRPQFCARCGETFIEREENRFCKTCRTERKKKYIRKFMRETRRGRK